MSKNDSVVHQKLQQLSAQIKERELYLEQVEMAIDKAVIEGNDRLHELQFEVDKLLEKQNKLLHYDPRLEFSKPMLYN